MHIMHGEIFIIYLVYEMDGPFFVDIVMRLIIYCVSSMTSLNLKFGYLRGREEEYCVKTNEYLYIKKEKRIILKFYIFAVVYCSCHNITDSSESENSVEIRNVGRDISDADLRQHDAVAVTAQPPYMVYIHVTSLFTKFNSYDQNQIEVKHESINGINRLTY